MSFLRKLFAPPDPKSMKILNDVEGLIEALHYLDIGVRVQAAEALGEICDPRAVEDLMVTTLKDRDERMRKTSAVALKQISAKQEDPEFQTQLVKALKIAQTDKLETIRQAATEALDIFNQPSE